jgi:hypothetical protein
VQGIIWWDRWPSVTSWPSPRRPQSLGPSSAGLLSVTLLAAAMWVMVVSLAADVSLFSVVFNHEWNRLWRCSFHVIKFIFPFTAFYWMDQWKLIGRYLIVYR